MSLLCRGVNKVWPQWKCLQHHIPTNTDQSRTLRFVKSCSEFWKWPWIDWCGSCLESWTACELQRGVGVMWENVGTPDGQIHSADTGAKKITHNWSSKAPQTFLNGHWLGGIHCKLGVASVWERQKATYQPVHSDAGDDGPLESPQDEHSQGYNDANLPWFVLCIHTHTLCQSKLLLLSMMSEQNWCIAARLPALLESNELWNDPLIGAQLKHSVWRNNTCVRVCVFD